MYATPGELVSFIVRSVHLLLQGRLGKRNGLADKGVRLLDPAAGPMNFVVEAYRVALEHVRRTRERPPIEALIRKHLLLHFHGVEILPSACATGREQVRTFFEAEGYSLGGDERVPLYRADALASPFGEAAGEDLGEDTRIARLIIGCEPLTVILGNPPWSGYRNHQGAWISSLLRGYIQRDGSWEEGYYRIKGKLLEERNTKWLQDDYVKFLRLCQWKIDQVGVGVVALVVNHTCLDAPTFRGLRHSLMRTFNEVYALDLHGNRRKGEETPAGRKDENVFPGVSQGAAVLLLVKDGGSRLKMYRADLYGTRREKLSLLGSSDVELIEWTEVHKGTPFSCARAKADCDSRPGLPLPEIFPVYSLGVVTGNNGRTVAATREEFGREAPEEVLPFLVRPFDRQFIRYRRDLLARPRESVMQHLLPGGNVALLVLRQSGTLGPAALVTRILAGHKVLSGYFGNSVFPLYLSSEEGERLPNLSPTFWRVLSECVGATPSPEDVLGYVYAVLYHPAYREEYRRELENAFPRIPYPLTEDLFWSLSERGRELVRIHLLEEVKGSLRVEGDQALPLGRNFTYEDGRFQLGDGLWVEGVEPEVWSYRLGGYQVLERWLRSRAGRVLTASELCHFGEIAEALRQTVVVQRVLAETDDPEEIAKQYDVPTRQTCPRCRGRMIPESPSTFGHFYVCTKCGYGGYHGYDLMRRKVGLDSVKEMLRARG